MKPANLRLWTQSTNVHDSGSASCWSRPPLNNPPPLSTSDLQAAGQAYGQQGYGRQQGYGLYEDQGAAAGGCCCGWLEALLG